MITLSIGSIFAGRYRLVRLIGQGGMGAVFEVVHVETERHCALKVMQPNMVDNDALRARFRQEAKVAALVNSEHIVDVYDAGFDETTQMPFLVMELLSGVELRQQLKAQGRFKPEEVALYLFQTALALDKTHRSNIIHRDLKPENLYLTYRENGAPHIKILDFGVAKFVTESSSHTSATRDVGTPLYMGPEQFTMGAKPSPQTDIYALGMIAYALLVGTSYWADDTDANATIYAFAVHVIKGPPELPTVRALRRGVRLPPAFDTWFARATAREPTQRFPSALIAANELADALGVPRTTPEHSMSMSNVGMRVALSSTMGGSAAAIGITGPGIGSTNGDHNNATGAPLATTSGARKEVKGRIVFAAIGVIAALTLVIGAVVILQSTARGTPVAAESSRATPSPASATAGVPTISANTPTITAVVDAAASASATTAMTGAPKNTIKATSPAKPNSTGVNPKKDLFTRD